MLKGVSQTLGLTLHPTPPYLILIFIDNMIYLVNSVNLVIHNILKISVLSGEGLTQ